MNTYVRDRDSPSGEYVDEGELVEINSFPGYYISPKGFVVSYKRSTPLILTPGLSNVGYYFYTLIDENGNKRVRYLHKLVAETFIPNPEGHKFVLHWDDNKLNNEVSNLRWGTVVDNFYDAVRNGKCYMRPVYCYETDTTYESLAEAAKSINCTSSEIQAACSGRVRSVKGCHFCYAEDIRNFTEDELRAFLRYNKRTKTIGKNMKTGDIVVFHSRTDASKETGASVAHICDVINGRSKSAKGWIFFEDQ